MRCHQLLQVCFEEMGSLLRESSSAMGQCWELVRWMCLMSFCHHSHLHRDKNGKCQFQQCNGVYTEGHVRDFESYFLKARSTTTTPGCRKACIGALTCDYLIKSFGRTCAQLEKSMSACDCSGCLCPGVVTTPSTTSTLDQSYPFTWYKYDSKEY